MKLLYLTNIPTPYRNARFNKMNKIFKSYGIDVTVYFMANTEKGRSWEMESMVFNYDYYVDKGFYSLKRGIHWHFNPKILKLLRRNKFDIAIVGGIASPTHWLAPYFINKNGLKILSVESNVNSEKRKSKFARAIKSNLIKKYDAYQITGDRAQEYLKQISPDVEDKPIVTLPNVIDEENFNLKKEEKIDNIRKIRDMYKIKDNEQIWICPARLESFKGLDKILPATKNLTNVKLIIAGDGSQRVYLENLVKEENLPVIFTGYIEPDELAMLYWGANVFLLPSISDASPLSAIEASYVGLPLLLSNLIGNFHDVCTEQGGNKNGWGFDPYNSQEVLSKLLQEISLISLEQLKKMGELSKLNYDKKFNIQNCLNSYAKQLLEVVNNNSKE